jgi:protein-L-isoaspartate(D-aspartate) O-methyltransferase
MLASPGFRSQATREPLSCARWRQRAPPNAVPGWQRYTGPGTLHRVTPDSESLRRRLVEDLSRRGLIRGPAVEDAFLRVPRERFVPELADERGLEAVYRDEALATKMDGGHAVSSSSQPAIMAEMLERLDLAPGQRVLEIGAGTGYNAALLAELAGDVVTLDVDAEVADKARTRLAGGGHAAEVVVCDGMAGWPPGAPYDRIIVTATPPHLPAAWRDQLREGGLLEVPLPLGREGAVAFVVVTFRRAGDELVSTAIVPGAFMAFRGPDGRRGDPFQPRLGWYDRARPRWTGADVLGPGVARLRPATRRRLLAALVAGARRTGLGRGAGDELLLYLVCDAPARRLVGVGGAGDWRLGLVDGEGGMAVLHHRWDRTAHAGAIDGEVYGEPGAADRDLRDLVGRWNARGRPALADFEVRVAFGRPPRGVEWRLPSGGDARVGVRLRR